MDAIDFSLILSTKDRVEDLARFLERLSHQTHRSFELIISDQNVDGKINSIVDQYSTLFSIRYIRSAGGISRGRNAGIPFASGRFIAFPDDDCRYPDELLSTVYTLMDMHPEWDVLTGRSVNDAMQDTQGRWYDREVVGSRKNIFNIGISYTIFARAEVVSQVGHFDDSLGVGAGTPWGSGEETDFLLRVLNAGKTIQYLPEIRALHSEKVVDYSIASRNRQFQYARGMGHVLRKHRFSYRECAPHFFRPLLASALFLCMGQASRSLYYARIFWGRACGWCDALPTPDRSTLSIAPFRTKSAG